MRIGLDAMVTRPVESSTNRGQPPVGSTTRALRVELEAGEVRRGAEVNGSSGVEAAFPDALNPQADVVSVAQIERSHIARNACGTIDQ